MESRTAAAMLALIALALAGGYAAIVPAAPVSTPTTVHAAAINFNLNYSDPASDVAELWTSNNSHVTTATGAWILSPNPSSVNLIRLSSVAGTATVSVFLGVQGAIVTLPNTTYEYRLYTRSDNTTHYIVSYKDGTTTLISNHTGSTVVNLTSSTQIGATRWLEVTVSKADLGGVANITTWNIDATSKMVGTNYTFEDYVWSQPGNPASAPAAIQGHVTDATTGAPLKGVNVSVPSGGFYTTTNSSGYYLLPATYGNLTVSFSLAGYSSQTKAVTVNVSSTATVNAQLSPVPPPPSLGDFAWLIAAVVIVAVLAIAALVILRRRSRSKPKQPPTQ